MELPADTPRAAAAAPVFVPPSSGTPPQQRWIQGCTLAPELVAAGEFATAMRLLHRWVPALTSIFTPRLVSSLRTFGVCMKDVPANVMGRLRRVSGRACTAGAGCCSTAGTWHGPQCERIDAIPVNQALKALGWGMQAAGDCGVWADGAPLPGAGRGHLQCIAWHAQRAWHPLAAGQGLGPRRPLQAAHCPCPGDTVCRAWLSLLRGALQAWSHMHSCGTPP